ncbi:AIPR protein [Stackebrandtia albiflava]|uniref:AIPR protein n=1 Tax=Stackebrandtia albiflava TaxID=406432 RepID=A0A562UL71_9ACTN|nr:AIPR family protein [Stackebrandtia albiflava]TWJ06371.1 AIPR protein [Stackebrandtia albiflava]
MKQMFVRQVRQALEKDFTDLIHLEDVKPLPAEQQVQHFRTRALTALTVQHLLGCTPEVAASYVIDGNDDNGIDAVAIDLDTAHIWLVQTKWSDGGTASLKQEAAMKLAEGFRLLSDGKHQAFNSRYQKLVNGIDQVVDDPNIKVSFVLALMGDASVADAALRPLERVRDDFNTFSYDPRADIHVLRLPELHGIVRAGIDGQPIDLKVLLENCGQVPAPYAAYYGSVSADQVAVWFTEHGERLFKKNIRTGLGRTSVNQNLIQTLTEEPQHFWYFNNGITMLCEQIERTGRGRLAVGGFGEIMLRNVSIVNGAQTVTAIHSACQESEDARNALVWIRIIETAENGTAFATRVTEATNTQNRVLEQDFAALDQTQQNLKVALESRGLVYLVRRGEQTPADAEGCNIEEALLALACTGNSIEFVCLAKSNPDRLWDRSGNGAYRRLFPSRITELKLWRSVQLYRDVLARIKQRLGDLDHRGESLARHGDLLTAHLVAGLLDQSKIDQEGFDWDAEVLTRVPELTDAVLSHVIQGVDEVCGPGSYPSVVFRREDRCASILEYVNQRMGKGTPIPPVFASRKKQRPKRQAKATTLLIQHGLIEEGTRLEFRAQTKRERQILTRWLAQDPARSRATWTNDKARPLIWEVDGRNYAPTGLVQHMLKEAGQGKPPALQGTKYWYLSGRGSLVDLAASHQGDLDVTG